jgi:hypothetical protein
VLIRPRQPPGLAPDEQICCFSGFLGEPPRVLSAPADGGD